MTGQFHEEGLRINIILGASGQIGSLLVRELAGKGKPVRAVIRDASKGKRLREMGVEVAIADYLSVTALQEAFHGGDAVFLLTPENPFLEQPDQEVRQIIANYQEAVRASSIRRIVGLSSMGAQHDSGTGSLLASHWLEQAFAGTDRECRFIRPAYYYSNWLGYLEQMQQHGVLPLFPA
ncbi:SDR family oxidoreductase [Paenibacillus sp. 1P07SE]|uniref:SDR family oxidoreductase n=1 Tax=Paenibacillus sp. 1P07SE TaxID=3132209 RepID=UPI0039A57664